MPDLVIRPNTTIYLTNVPWESDYKNVMRFASTEDAVSQITSIAGTRILTNYSYQNKNSFIRAKGNVNEFEHYNYCVIINGDLYNSSPTGYEMPLFCFIERVNYVNPNTTHLYLNLDVWQTYGYDVIFPTMMIEREHTNDDSLGSNILDEGIDVDANMVVYNTNITSLYTNGVGFCVVVGVTKRYDEGRLTPLYVNNALFSGIEYHAFDITNQGGRTHFNEFTSKYLLSQGDLNPDDIVTIFTMPLHCLQLDSEDDNRIIGNPDFQSAVGVPTSVFINFGTYTPKNKKMFTFPFIKFRVTNEANMYADFLFEYLNTNYSGTIPFDIKCACVPQSTLYVGIRDYKTTPITGGYAPAVEYYPIANTSSCAWAIDSYYSYLANNRVNMVVDSAKMLTNFAKDAMLMTMV